MRRLLPDGGAPGAVALFAFLAASFSCADLPSRELNVCGNGILEVNALEDCDSEKDCVPPGEPEACSWVCDEDTACPDGYGCGQDSVCRAPSHELVRGAALGEGDVPWIEAADFDGDGRDELAIVEDNLLSVAYWNPSGELDTRSDWRHIRSRPKVVDIDEDGLLDFFLLGNLQWYDTALDSFGGEFAGLSGGRTTADRGFSAALLVEAGNVEIADPGGCVEAISGSGEEDLARVQFVGLRVDGERIAESTGLPLVSALKSGQGAAIQPSRFIPDEPVVVTRLALVTGDPVGPLEYRAEVSVFDHAAGSDSVGTWDPEPIVVRLPATWTIPPWVGWEDLNEDGLLDLIVQRLDPDGDSAPSELRVAYAQPNGEFNAKTDGTGVPNFFGGLVAVPGDSSIVTRGHFNDDGRLDYVFDGAVAISGEFEAMEGRHCSSVSFEFTCIESNSLLNVDYAAIMDTDGDGRHDIITAGKGNAFIEVVRQGSSPSTTNFGHEVVVPLAGTVVELDAAYVDSDASLDLVIRTEGPEGPESPGAGDDRLYVWWGGRGFDAPELVLSDVELGDGTCLLKTPITSAPPKVRMQLLVEEDGAYRNAIGYYGGDETLLFGLLPDLESGWYMDLVRGSPGGTGGPTLAVAGLHVDVEVNQNSQEEYGEDDLSPDGVDERMVVATMEARHGGHFDFSLSGAEFSGTESVLEDIPPFASLSGTRHAADLDGDGSDEVILVGAQNTEVWDAELRLNEGGIVAVHSFADDGWSFDQEILVEDAVLGGDWPFVDRLHQSEIIDLDGDGELDLFMMGNAEHDGGATTRLALYNRAGAFEEESLLVVDAEPDAPWLAWSFMGLHPDGGHRVALVRDGRLITGVLDGETFELDEEASQAAPADAFGSAAGDFDGDGLQDLAVATRNGVVLYMGQRRYGPQQDE